MKIAKKFYILNIFLNVLILFVIFLGQADAWVIGGTVYTDEGITNIGANKTVKVVVNGDTSSCTDETGASGYYWCSVTANAGDIITVFLDNEPEDGTTVTRFAGGDDNWLLDIYKNHVIARTEPLRGIIL